jgi:hypothetical protein
VENLSKGSKGKGTTTRKADVKVLSKINPAIECRAASSAADPPPSECP